MFTIIIWCLVIGILLILSTLTKFSKGKITKSRYKLSNFNKLLSKFKDNKIFTLLIEEGNYSDQKVLEKIKIINQCRKSEKIYKYNPITKVRKLREVDATIKERKYDSISINGILNKEEELNKSSLKNIYFAKICIFLTCITILFSIKITFNNLLVQQALNSETIYTNTQYKFSSSDIRSITNHIGNSYKKYIKNNDSEGLIKDIFTYSNENKLSIDKNDAKIFYQIYKDVYEKGRIKTLDLIFIILITIMSTFLVDIYINIRYKLYNLKLSSEFQKVELIALLHMNRKDLNVYEILKEVSEHTVYLRPAINRCLNRYHIENTVALDKLILEVNNPDFTSFVAVLKSSLDTSKDINSDVLKLQRKLRLLNDNIDADKRLNFKSLCLTIAQFPLILLFTINLMIPLIDQLNISNLNLIA